MKLAFVHVRLGGKVLGTADSLVVIHVYHGYRWADSKSIHGMSYLYTKLAGENNIIARVKTKSFVFNTGD